MRDRRVIALLAATLAAGGAVAGVTMGNDDQSRRRSSPNAAQRSCRSRWTPTTHVFDAETRGGTQRVVADDPSDGAQIRLVRLRLRKEAAAFRRGDFADPASIHGDDMSGLAALKTGFKRIDVRYRDLPDGAEIVYRTDDRSLAAAVASWFNAQLADDATNANSLSGTKD